MTSAAPPSWRVQEHKTLASTQDAAIAAARAGDPGRLAILAATQTAGRGSRGRGWLSPAGNLNLSVLLRPDASVPPGLYALLAGVALHEALSAYAAGLMLKWPNDLLLGGAKLGGILIDASFAAAGVPDWVVIGIGANLAVAPHIAGRETAALPPPAPRPRAIAEKILARLDDTGNIADSWRTRAHPMGTQLLLSTATRSIEGRFEGITETGALRLSGHAEPISSGEVFLTPAVRADAAPEPRHTEAAQTCCW